MILYPLLILIAILLYLFFHPITLKDRIMSTIFIFLYALLYFGGGLILESLASKIGEFKGIGQNELGKVYQVATISLGALLIGVNVKLPNVRSRLDQFTHIRQIRFASFFLAFGSIALYVAINGFVLLKSGGYTNRYESNVGFGMVTLLFPFGLIFLNCHYLVVKNKIWVVIIALIFAILVFTAKGGQRQIGFAAMFNFFLFLYIEGRVSLKKLFLWGLFGLIAINVIALLRYYDSFEGVEVSELYTLVAYFFFDGIVPVDAFYKIIEYVDKSTPPGFEIVINQFGALVPRLFWTSKPEIMLNAGNFYTMNILQREMFVTYSPTFLGELYLIGGTTACIIGGFVTGVILKLLDNIIRYKRGFVMIYVISFSFLFTFNLYREGLFVFLSSIISFLVYLIPVMIVIKFLPYKNNLKNEGNRYI